MTREEAIGILDAVIPPPEHHTVDLDHLPIAQAWLCIKGTLTAELQWIPISERTPGAEHVLVTLKWGEDDYEVTELDYAADVACGGRIAQYVVAWMPLPDPYKEERDGY